MGCELSYLAMQALFIALRLHSSVPPAPPLSRAPCAPPPPHPPRGESPLPPPSPSLLLLCTTPTPFAFVSQARYVYLIIELLKDLVSLGP